MRHAIAVLTLLLGCHCNQTKLAIEPPLPIPAGDAGDPCALACAKLCMNGCAAGCAADPDAGAGSACVRVCRIDQAQQTASQLDPSCILSATTVQGIEACGTTCQ